MPCRATQDGRVVVESSDKMWSTGEGNGKPLQYSCLENPMNSMKRQKERTLKDELPRLVGAQYATGEQWRNNSRKNEETESKQKQYPGVDVTSDGSKVWCCKVQYCIQTWNVRSLNQGKLEVVKQEMAGVNIDILGINKLKWTGMSEFNSDDHCIYYSGKESLRRNGVGLIVNKRVWNAVHPIVLECNLKNHRMICVCFQGKPFNHSNLSLWRKWQPTPVFLPGENPIDRGAWQATVHGVTRVRHRLATKERELPQPVVLKKMKLNSSMKTYKTF